MKVELTRDVSLLLTKGNRYTANKDVGGYKISIGTDMIVPAEFVEVIPIKLMDGTILEEHAVYDITYRQDYGRNNGRPKTLRGWEVLYGKEDWKGEPGVALLHRGSRYGGKRQDLSVSQIMSATLIEVVAEDDG